jgi:hypothetical protein
MNQFQFFVMLDVETRKIKQAFFNEGLKPRVRAPASIVLSVKSVTWIGSVQRAVATWSVISTRYFLRILTPMVDQVATARCTDPIQE